jgi:hypothetical protein
LEMATHHALNHSKRTKSEKDMRLELEASLESFFKFFEANYHSCSSCVFCVAPLLVTSKNICSPPVCMSNNIKIAQLD